MASDTWRECSVEELKSSAANALATGPFGSAISSRFFQSSGVPVIRGSNLSQDIGIRIIDDGLAFVSDDKASEFNRSIARRGDLVFTCWGTIDQVGLIDGRAKFSKYVVSNKQMKLTPDSTKADSLFLYYVFSSPQMRNTILNQGIGSSVPGFNLGQLRRLPLLLPPIGEQRAIASILGALDDKIELNRRMNETLEAMARATFKSWFVDFDPVRAKLDNRPPKALDPQTAALFPDSFEHAEFGLVPDGWNVSTVGDEFKLTMGQSPPGETYNETGDGIPFFQGRRDFGFRFPSVRVFCTGPTRFAEKNDTLVSVRAPVGDLNLASQRCCVGRGVAAVRHKSGSRSYTYYAMGGLETDFARFEAEGTVFGSINKRNFQALPMIAPTETVVSAFDRLVGPMDDRIEVNSSQGETLAATRDALLPKLLSGELRVKDAEKLAESHL